MGNINEVYTYFHNYMFKKISYKNSHLFYNIYQCHKRMLGKSFLPAELFLSAYINFFCNTDGIRIFDYIFNIFVSPDKMFKCVI